MVCRLLDRLHLAVRLLLEARDEVRERHSAFAVLAACP
jgi:hypothetical protein